MKDIPDSTEAGTKGALEPDDDCGATSSRKFIGELQVLQKRGSGTDPACITALLAQSLLLHTYTSFAAEDEGGGGSSAGVGSGVFTNNARY